MFVGFNMTFLPQHMLGLLGMPRRVYTYHQGGLWEVYNSISTGRRRPDGDRGRGLRREHLDHARPAQGRPRRERPVARRHARVVHDLAAAAAQLRLRPVRDERAAAARPAPAPRGGAAREDRRLSGPVAAPVGARRCGRDAARGRLRRRRARDGAPAAGGARRAAARRARRLGVVRAPAARAPALAAAALFAAAAAVSGPHAHATLAAFALAAIVVVGAESFRGERDPLG